MMVKHHIDTLISIEFQHHPLPILKKVIIGDEDNSGEKMVLMKKLILVNKMNQQIVTGIVIMNRSFLWTNYTDVKKKHHPLHFQK